MKFEKIDENVTLTMTMQEAEIMRRNQAMLITLMTRTEVDFFERYSAKTGSNIDMIEEFAYTAVSQLNRAPFKE